MLAMQLDLAESGLHTNFIWRKDGNMQLDLSEGLMLAFAMCDLAISYLAESLLGDPCYLAEGLRCYFFKVKQRGI